MNSCRFIIKISIQLHVQISKLYKEKYGMFKPSLAVGRFLMHDYYYSITHYKVKYH